ncbi:MAG: hypothetical protein WD024_06885 [Bacillota bacterium]
MAGKTKATGTRTRTIYTDDQKERAIAVFTTCGNLSRTSRETGVPISTLKGWLAEQPQEEVAKARLDAKTRFIGQAWDTVLRGIQVGDTVMSFALENKGRIDEAVKAVLKSDFELDQKADLVHVLASLTKFSMKDLAIYIGTVYDKIALATGKPTGINRLEGQVTEKHVYDITERLIAQNPGLLNTIFPRDTERNMEDSSSQVARPGLGEVH